jgi:hypothetical protein
MELSANAIQLGVKEEARRFIPTIASANDVYKLFHLLKYPEDKLFDPSYKRDVAEFEFKKEERDKIKVIYTVFSYEKDLPVFLMETTTTSHPFLKYVTKVLADRYLRFLLIATTDYEEIAFVLPDYERVETGKHKLRISKLVLDKDDLYYTDLETIVNIAFQDEKSWRDLWKKWRQAFDVEKVTELFFLDYQEIFFRVRSVVVKQKIATKDAHEFTLQLLNRIMFIYFVSKKRWLNNDPKFMRWLWNRYLLERNKGKAGKDSFYSHWLTVVFFEAFNNRFRNNTILPDDVKKVFRDAPYLNGGLFRKGDLDNLSVRVSDDLFKEIFQFFERYNFTIREDLLDAEVAVDPQMIGYVYESLANVAESSYEREEDLRGTWGIFYTPRIEVEFMCKRAVVEYLASNMPEVSKEKAYQFVFDEDKEKAEVFFDKEGLWYDLEELLDGLSVVDPACGSGAFLVGMVNVLSELYRVIYRHVKRDLTDFELKNKIIMGSLYGVDVMPWAVHAAELRLWLQLIVESDLRPVDLKAHPLLPNLNMNLRIGDSLVQEIGGINLHVRDPAIAPKLKQRLMELKSEKEKYFNNDPTAKFKSKEDLEAEEVRIFSEVIKGRAAAFLDEKARLSKKLQELERGVQKDLYGNVTKTPSDQIEPIKNRLLETESQVDTLDRAAKTLHDPEKKPFVWEIGFAEIFGEKGGFDIVIGNPPYVRQEDIAPPTKPRDQISNDEKRKYKDKLFESVKSHLAVSKIDKKSDYYLYFYFDGLSLLNSKGTFCFITSNAWLDVDYGTELQEFLCKYVPIKGIYDNPKRSFARADINTVIVVFGAPIHEDIPTLLSPESYAKAATSKWPALANVAKLIMFKKTFEEVANSKVLWAIETADRIENSQDYRLFAMPQSDLLAEGWEYPEEYDESKEGRFRRGEYDGNKWGGKYLRAPDVFFTVLERGKGKLTKLGNIAKVNRGITTGSNEFFILSQQEARKLKIEKEFLKPILVTPKESRGILVSKDRLSNYVFFCTKSKKSLSRTNALKYILNGERQKVTIRSGGNKGQVVTGYNKLETLKNRKEWWNLGNKQPSQINCNYLVNDLMRCYYSDEPIFAIDNFQQVRPSKAPKELCAVLNSTLFALSTNIQGRANFGGGLMKMQTYEIRNILTLDIPSIDPDICQRLRLVFDKLASRELGTIFEECGIDPSRPIRDQNPRPPLDRKHLDDIMFDMFGLTESERKEVYWSVCELVKTRLDKAKSLKKKEG